MKSEELKTMAWDDMRGVGGGGWGGETNISSGQAVFNDLFWWSSVMMTSCLFV